MHLRRSIPRLVEIRLFSKIALARQQACQKKHYHFPALFSSKPWRQGPKSSFSFSWNIQSLSAFGILVSCAALPVMYAENALPHGSNGDKDDSEKLLSLTEASLILKQKLASFRKTLPRPPAIYLAQDPSTQTISVRMIIDQSKGSSAITSFIGKLYALSKNQVPSIEVHSADTSSNGEVLSFLLRDQSGSILLKSSFNVYKSEFTFFKEKGLQESELEAIVATYKTVYGSSSPTLSRGGVLRDDKDLVSGLRGLFQGQFEDSPSSSNPVGGGDPLATLTSLGAEVYDAKDNKGEQLDWDAMAGYDHIKQEIDETLVMALKHPQVFEDIAKETRCRYESNRPRAILFEGPPGTGKTLTARIIASQVDLPMVHLRLDKVVSKWYGESEKRLGQILDVCGELDGVLLFIDEVDALATSRGDNSSEPARKLLSVLLQSIEGFATKKRVTLICATNRKQDLDAAMLSRFNLSIRFDLPEADARAKIFSRYARQLSLEELDILAEAASSLSCRDIKEVCEQTERQWAANLLKKRVTQKVPDLQAYLHATEYRSHGMLRGRNTTEI